MENKVFLQQLLSLTNLTVSCKKHAGLQITLHETDYVKFIPSGQEQWNMHGQLNLAPYSTVALLQWHKSTALG